jgi:hypothetical protein
MSKRGRWRSSRKPRRITVTDAFGSKRTVSADHFKKHKPKQRTPLGPTYADGVLRTNEEWRQIWAAFERKRAE